MRTEVAIIGAGPSGLLLAHLLAEAGVESVVVEARSRGYVEGRIRAGLLEHSSVELLDTVGLGDRLRREGLEHRGIYLQWPGERHHLDFVDLVGHSVWIYGQTELQKDLGRAADARGQQIHYEARDTAIQDLDTDHPSVTFTSPSGSEHRLEARVVVGCDGSFGPSRQAVPESARSTWERTYPYAWLGILAEVAPSSDELVYAWHPEGFALHSMRSRTISRFYLQVSPDEDVANWSEDRIWSALATRLGDEPGGWRLSTGPILEKSVLPMHSFVMEPMRHASLFLAGDAAHIVPPTGAKGLNLAIADVALLAPALAALVRARDERPAAAYSEAALRRVWRSTHFSWWMTTMLHTTGDPFDARLQRAQLELTVGSEAAATALAETYAGLRIGS